MKPSGPERLGEWPEIQSNGSQARRRLLPRGLDPRARGYQLLGDRLHLPTRPLYSNASRCARSAEAVCPTEPTSLSPRPAAFETSRMVFLGRSGAYHPRSDPGVVGRQVTRKEPRADELVQCTGAASYKAMARGGMRLGGSARPRTRRSVPGRRTRAMSTSRNPSAKRACSPWSMPRTTTSAWPSPAGWSPSASA
jgi:hypothetical protein